MTKAKSILPNVDKTTNFLNLSIFCFYEKTVNINDNAIRYSWDSWISANN